MHITEPILYTYIQEYARLYAILVEVGATHEQAVDLLEKSTAGIEVINKIENYVSDTRHAAYCDGCYEQQR